MSKNKFNRRSSKYKLLAMVLVVILLGTTLLVLEKTGVTDFYSKGSDDSAQGQDSDLINYKPPTEEEKQAGDSQKDEIIQDEASRNAQSNQNKRSASVIITDAGQYDDVVEVRAFISDHYQDGTCTITFTKDTHKVQKTTPAYRDASTSICTNPLFQRSEFPVTGDWQLVVNYIAGGASGQATKTVSIL